MAAKFKSVIAELNKYKSNWRTRAEVNSTISSITNKLQQMKRTRDKELKLCTTEEAKRNVHKAHDNSIKFYDFLLYKIKFDYDEIVSKLP
jgi:hypothetical protein